jgi:hypothetical protein
MKGLKAFLDAVQSLLLGAGMGPLARGAWCRRQRALLRRPDHGVVWVGRESVPWAEWGASHGFFELERMAGLPYLSALPAAAK